MKLRSKRDDDHHCMSCVRWSDCWLLKVLQTLPDAGSGSLLKKSPTACFYVFYISKCNPWSDQVELLLSYVWKSASKIHIYCRLIQLCREWYFHCEFQFCGLENKDVGLWRVAGVVKYSRCYTVITAGGSLQSSVRSSSQQLLMRSLLSLPTGWLALTRSETADRFTHNASRWCLSAGGCSSRFSKSSSLNACLCVWECVLR